LIDTSADGNVVATLPCGIQNLTHAGTAFSV
jgi:hypothetical protein